jgi:hypothetical protein
MPPRTQTQPPITVSRAPWSEVLGYFAREHRLGEHVSVEGPTGSGKSLLSVMLLLERGKRGSRNGRPTSIVVLCDKPRDRTMQLLTAAGWRRMTDLRDWPPPYGDEQVILWPAYGDPQTVAGRQRAIFEPALREIFLSGGQIVYIDEAEYFSETPPDGLGLKGLLNQYWGKSRANELTLFATTQRPVAVPRKMWSEPYWLFIFRPEDEDDLKRVAELSGSKQLVLDVVPTLDTHEFLMLRRRPERLAIISQVDIKAVR